MDVARSRKTTRVLYLYLTIPLLILTAVLGMIAMMTHAKKDSAPKSTAMPEAPVHYGPGPESAGSSSEAGSSWSSRRPSIELAPLDVPVKDEKNEDESDSPRDSTAGNAAIMTAIMGGLTGLMGAMTQTFMAFLRMRERRRSESGDEESREALSDDEAQG